MSSTRNNINKTKAAEISFAALVFVVLLNYGSGCFGYNLRTHKAYKCAY
jgi:hypothetical protein